MTNSFRLLDYSARARLEQPTLLSHHLPQHILAITRSSFPNQRDCQVGTAKRQIRTIVADEVQSLRKHG